MSVKAIVGVIILVIVVTVLFSMDCTKSETSVQPVTQKYTIGQIIKMKIDDRVCQIVYSGFSSGWVLRCPSPSGYIKIIVSEIEIKERG